MNSEERRSSPPAIVIGAGPAGLSAALGLSRAGFEVRVLERKKEWTGRVCGSFLSPEALGHLEWLGLLKTMQKEGVPSSAARVYGPDGGFQEMPLAQNGVSGLALPRKILEEALVKAAEKAGVEIRWGVQASKEDFSPGDVAVTADGRFSSIGAEAAAGKEGWFGWNAEFKGLAQEPGGLSLHFFPGGYIGTLAFADGSSNVSGLVHSSLKKKAGVDWEKLFERLIRSRPDLEQLFENAERVSPFRGVAALPFGLHVEDSPGIFRVGDAAGVCDPFMGEGIARALSAGPMLFKLFEKRLKTPEAIQAAYGEYVRMWKASYAVRVRVGLPLRAAIRRRWSTSAMLALLSKRAVQSPLLARIHSA